MNKTKIRIYASNGLFDNKDQLIEDARKAYNLGFRIYKMRVVEPSSIIELVHEFKKEFTQIYGDLAFVALSMKDYENLALNIADIKRYLEQQKEIIIYYEKAVKEEENKK